MQGTPCISSSASATMLPMTFPLDRRTRYDADNRPVTPDEFFDKELPEHVARHGALVAEGMRALDARPLGIEVGDRAWSFTSDGETVVVRDGIVDDAFVVTLTEELFSDWVQQQRSFNGMVVGRLLQSRNGTEHDVSVWDSLWLAMLEGWPVVDDELQFVDRHGAPLDLHQHFTPDDDPADVAHFIREAGYLHLRGWIDPALMETISDDIDRAVPHYTDGDGKSWWADLEDGTHTCVRLQEFLGHSPTTEAILRSELWDQLRRTVAGDDDLVQAPVEGRCLEALIKPVGVVAGASDVELPPRLPPRPSRLRLLRHGGWHRRQPHQRGERLSAGSRRLPPRGHPGRGRQARPYLPVVGLPTEPGDVTIHLSCTLHESLPPRIAERKVMYGGGFNLAPRPGRPRRRRPPVRAPRERVQDPPR